MIFYIHKHCNISFFIWAISFNSAGDMLQTWSGPTMVLSNVKCFSKILAPRAHAASAAAMPTVWSLKPAYFVKSTRLQFKSSFGNNDFLRFVFLFRIQYPVLI